VPQPDGEIVGVEHNDRLDPEALVKPRPDRRRGQESESSQPDLDRQTSAQELPCGSGWWWAGPLPGRSSGHSDTGMFRIGSDGAGAQCLNITGLARKGSPRMSTGRFLRYKANGGGIVDAAADLDRRRGRSGRCRVGPVALAGVSAQ